MRIEVQISNRLKKNENPNPKKPSLKTVIRLRKGKRSREREIAIRLRENTYRNDKAISLLPLLHPFFLFGTDFAINPSPRNHILAICSSRPYIVIFLADKAAILLKTTHPKDLRVTACRSLAILTARMYTR